MTVTQNHSVATYWLVFAALMLLTALTVGVALVDLGALNNAVALTIAGAKAGLVTTWFMHARYGSTLVQATIAAGLLWLVILIGLTLADFATRGW